MKLVDQSGPTVHHHWLGAERRADFNGKGGWGVRDGGRREKPRGDSHDDQVSERSVHCDVCRIGSGAVHQTQKLFPGGRAGDERAQLGWASTAVPLPRCDIDRS